MVTVISALKILHYGALSFCNYIHIKDCMQSIHLQVVLLSELKFSMKCNKFIFSCGN